jgi:hypothetical protein
MSWKTSHNTKQSIESHNAENSGQTAQASRDLLQIGRDYIQYIIKNSRSRNWGAVIIALIPLLLFFYGVTIIGDTVARVTGIKLPLNDTLLQASNARIREIEKQVKGLLLTNEIATKVQQQVEALQQTLNDQKIELDRQKKRSQQQDNQTQALESHINDLKDQLSKILRVPPAPGEKPASPTPPPGTAPKSWCLQTASIVRGHTKLGMDTAGLKAALEERNCGFWGVKIP